METADDVQLRPVTGAGSTRKSESSKRDTVDLMPERVQEPEQHDAAALEPQYPSPAKFWMALTTLCFGIFLITLVRHPGTVAFPCRSRQVLTAWRL